MVLRIILEEHDKLLYTFQLKFTGEGISDYTLPSACWNGRTDAGAENTTSR
jgi:hypothetical protein